MCLWNTCLNYIFFQCLSLPPRCHGSRFDIVVGFQNRQGKSRFKNQMNHKAQNVGPFSSSCLPTSRVGFEGKNK